MEATKELLEKLGRMYREKPKPRESVKAYQMSDGSYLTEKGVVSAAEFEANWERMIVRPRKAKP